jgi:hypothetical protein
VPASASTRSIGFATPDAHPKGRYDAQVAVPEGGIGGVQVGLCGSSEVGAGDTRFPLEDDPFAAPAREATPGRPVPTWLAPAGGLVLLGLLGAVVRRARRRTAAG